MHLNIKRLIVCGTLLVSSAYATSVQAESIEELIKTYQEKNQLAKQSHQEKLEQLRSNFITKLRTLRKSYEARGDDLKVLKIDEVIKKFKPKEDKVKPAKVDKKSQEDDFDFGAPPPPGEHAKPKKKKIKKILGQITKEQLIQELKEYNIGFTGRNCKIETDKQGYIIRVNLGGQPITDLTPISKLSHLQVLSLWGTGVYDLKPIAKLSTLQWLNLDNTLVTDISPLEGLKELKGVSLANLPIKDLEPLKGKDLEQLCIRDCLFLKDISVIADMKKLTRLILPPHFANLHITFIKDLPKLKTLDTKHWRKDGVWTKDHFLDENEGKIE